MADADGDDSDGKYWTCRYCQLPGIPSATDFCGACGSKYDRGTRTYRSMIMPRCTTCGEHNRGTKFCGNCGSERPPVTRWVCEICHFERNPTGMTFCGACGERKNLP